VAKLKTYFEQVPLEVVKRILKRSHAEKSGRVGVTEGTNIERKELKFPEWQKPLHDLFLEPLAKSCVKKHER
jgi:hypothetical protein